MLGGDGVVMVFVALSFCHVDPITQGMMVYGQAWHNYYMETITAIIVCIFRIHINYPSL